MVKYFVYGGKANKLSFETCKKQDLLMYGNVYTEVKKDSDGNIVSFNLLKHSELMREWKGL